MPVYEFECKCGHVFEELVRIHYPEAELSIDCLKSLPECSNLSQQRLWRMHERLLPVNHLFFILIKTLLVAT